MKVKLFDKEWEVNPITYKQKRELWQLSLNAFREDKEKQSIEFEDDIENIDNLLKYLINNKINFLIISDYQKGALTPNEMEYLLNKCKKLKIKSFSISRRSFWI